MAEAPKPPPEKKWLSASFRQQPGGQRIPASSPAATRAQEPQAKLYAQGGAAPTGTGLDSSRIRSNMVQRLIAQGLDSEVVQNAMRQVERHRFVDSALVNQAYEDTSLPIGLGQTISKPSVVARMLSLLCEGREVPLGRVLEIGTGCGYQATVMSYLAKEVYSIERRKGCMTRRARTCGRYIVLTYTCCLAMVCWPMKKARPMRVLCPRQGGIISLKRGWTS